MGPEEVAVEEPQQVVHLRLEDGWKIIWWQYNEKKYDYRGQRCWYDYDLLMQQKIEDAYVKHEKGSGNIVNIMIEAVNIKAEFDFDNMKQRTYPIENGEAMVRSIQRSLILAI